MNTKDVPEKMAIEATQSIEKCKAFREWLVEHGAKCSEIFWSMGWDTKNKAGEWISLKTCHFRIHFEDLERPFLFQSSETRKIEFT